MKANMRKSVLAVAAALSLGGQIQTAAAVQLLGSAAIPGNMLDQSGLRGVLEDGVTPHNQAGAFGSSIAYTGSGNLYIATPDRGPADGGTSYINRFYTLSIDIQGNSAAGFTVTPELQKTRLMRSTPHDNFTGSAAAFDPTNSVNSLRLDSEGTRVSACGHSIFVTDEYGPWIHEISIASGRRLRSLSLPNKFSIDVPSADPTVELTKNLSGRQNNRGLEGLAISPDGGKLYAVMQSPLIQDGGLDVALKRVGTNVRILEIDVASGAVREFLYALDDKGNGVNEIVAVNDHEFLVIERDSKIGAAAVVKKVFKIDISSATDIRAVKQLPSTGIPTGVTPVSKQLFINLLDPTFGLAGAGFPEKLEGLAFGPDLADGRHVLIVSSDNDLAADQDTKLYAFAVDHVDLPAFQAQAITPNSVGNCGKGVANGL